jgi:uncharacterized protein YkwD
MLRGCMGGRGRGRAARALAVAAFAWAAHGASAPPAHGRSKPAPALTPDAFERRVVALVNAERARHGLRSLERRHCPDTYATRWSASLARAERLRHQNVWKILETCGGRRAAENVATSSGGPEAVVRSWMRSRRHRQNILDPRFRTIGVGAARARSGHWYVVQNFLAF